MADDTVREDVARARRLPGVRLSDMVHRVSWGAIWAGVMIALGMEALFTLFGFFIGFGMYNAQAANPWAGVSSWTTIWYLITAGWSMFFGAWCAARLSGNPVREAAILHGFTTWGMSSIATMAVVTIAAWAVLREGIGVLAMAATTLPATAHAAARAAATAPPPNPDMAQATANILGGVALKIWIGVLVGFITALFGGWLGRAHTIVVETRDAAPLGPRMAA